MDAPGNTTGSLACMSSIVYKFYTSRIVNIIHTSVTMHIVEHDIKMPKLLCWFIVYYSLLQVQEYIYVYYRSSILLKFNVRTHLVN